MLLLHEISNNGMNGKQLNIRCRSAPVYSVHITHGALLNAGAWTRQCLGPSVGRTVVVSNPTVFALYGRNVIESLKKSDFSATSWLMNDGERYKNLRSVEAALKYFSSVGLGRDDVVVALGGGVVGDLAGFAASVYLRGIRFLQIPTTFVAMIDSSVGGKTGVNTEFGKNRIGSFHNPSGVLIDTNTLTTLPRREMTAGLCEAIKQAAVAGNPLFDVTARFLEKFGASSPSVHSKSVIDLIASHISFKSSIVRQDETEDPSRNDIRSRKILNFGHTFAHALEKLTNYRRFRHGEAVGHGIRFAAQLSKNLEILDQNELELLNDVVHRAGRLPAVPDIEPNTFLNTIRSDKKSFAGDRQWVLLKGVGKPLIVSDRDVPRKAVTAALKATIQR